MDPHGPLTADDLSRLRNRGFLVVRRLVDGATLLSARAAFDRLKATAASLPGSGLHAGSSFVLGERPDGGRSIRRVVWCGAAEPVLLRIGRCPAVLRIARQVLRANSAQHLINQAHYKEPGDGVEFPWHQDSHHRRYGTEMWTDVDGRGSFVEIALAIDAMGPHNGGLHFVPGSHREGHRPHDAETGGLEPGWGDPEAAVAVHLNPGDALVFGPYVIHGSPPNLSDQPRRTLLNGFALPGANRRDYPGEGAGTLVEL